MGDEPHSSTGGRSESDFDLGRLVKRIPERLSLEPGAVIFAEGDRAEHMYLIVEGQVRLSMNGEPVAMEQAGGFVGEMALIGHRRRSATATALSACELAPLDRDAFLELLREQPEFALLIMSVQADRLRLANDILSSI